MAGEGEQEHLKWLEKLAKESRHSLELKMMQRDKLIDEVTKLGRDTVALEQAINAIKVSMGLRKPELKQTRFGNMTVKEAAEIVLREHGGQMRTVDIIKAIQEGGKELGERAYSLVVTTLQRSDLFEKVDKGIFRLIPK